MKESEKLIGLLDIRDYQEEVSKAEEIRANTNSEIFNKLRKSFKFSSVKYREGYICFGNIYNFR